MNLAIQKLIATVKDKPDDELLLERIVTLLSMEPDSNDKVVMAMELARALEISRPRIALVFAKAIYEHQPRNLECLAFIAELFTRLGRHAKAEVIKAETEKLKNLIQRKVQSGASTTLQGKFQMTAPPPPPDKRPKEKIEDEDDALDREFSETVHSIVSVIQPAAQEVAEEEEQLPEFSMEVKKHVPDFSKVLRTSVAPLSMIQIRRAPKLARMAVFDPKE